MNIKKLISRLAVFVIGFPGILFLCWFSPYNKVCMHIVLLWAIVCAAFEMHNLLSSKSKIAPKPLLIILSILPTLLSYFCGIFPETVKPDYIPVMVCLCIITIISTEVFVPTGQGINNFENSLFSISAGIFHFVYCGILPIFISRLNSFGNSTAYLCTFFILVFGCDSLAWFFGMLFGKKNRGFIKISPNKSIAGFTGGILGTVGLSCLCKVVFHESYSNISYPIMMILGLITSILSIIGDLAESLLKRSSNCKDSGKIILGRGGMLDSVDSIFFSVPVFFYLVKFFINR